MTTTELHPSGAPPRSAGSAALRVVTASRREDRDPPEPWESPASEADLAELSTKRFERAPPPARIDDRGPRRSAG